MGRSMKRTSSDSEVVSSEGDPGKPVPVSRRQPHFQGSGMKVCVPASSRLLSRSGVNAIRSAIRARFCLRGSRWAAVARLEDVDRWSPCASSSGRDVDVLYVRAGAASCFCLCDVANVSGLTNNTLSSSEAASIIKKPARCTCSVGWLYFLKG